MEEPKLNLNSSISNFIKSWKKYGWKETIKKLKYQYIMLETPEGIIKKRIVGYVGGICGLILAMWILLMKGMWYVTIAIGFSILIMYANLKGDMKQLQVLKDLEEQFKKEIE